MAQGQRADEEHVRALDEEERIAALRRDIPALERLWSDQFAVNAPNNQVVVGRRAVLDTFVRAGVINFSTFEPASVTRSGRTTISSRASRGRTASVCAPRAC
jgi:hypothetical protein